MRGTYLKGVDLFIVLSTIAANAKLLTHGLPLVKVLEECANGFTVLVLGIARGKVWISSWIVFIEAGAYPSSAFGTAWRWYRSHEDNDSKTPEDCKIEHAYIARLLIS